MSLRKRIDSAIQRSFAYSARYVPAAMPIGVAISTANTQIIMLPAIALSRPPPSSPGGGVIWVNSIGLNAVTPLDRVVQQIQTRKARPISAAAPERSRAILLVRLRRQNRRWATAAIICPPGA